MAAPEAPIKTVADEKSLAQAAAAAVQSSDEALLAKMGYKQELKRGLSLLTNFGAAFTVLSFPTGVIGSFATAWYWGGPVTAIWGWILVSCMICGFVGVGMAELCSAYPTSGGLYYWAAKIGGKHGRIASWITGWFNLLGQVAISSSVMMAATNSLITMGVMMTMPSLLNRHGGVSLASIQGVKLHPGGAAFNRVEPCPVASFSGAAGARFIVTSAIAYVSGGSALYTADNTPVLDIYGGQHTTIAYSDSECLKKPWNPSQPTVFGIFVASMALTTAINCVPISVMNNIYKLNIAWHILGAMVIIIGLPAAARGYTEMPNRKMFARFQPGNWDAVYNHGVKPGTTIFMGYAANNNINFGGNGISVTTDAFASVPGHFPTTLITDSSTSTHHSNNLGERFLQRNQGTSMSPAFTYVFFCGMLMSQWSFTGYDACAHMVEETSNAALSGPRGIMRALTINAMFGFCFILTFCGSVTDFMNSIFGPIALNYNPAAQIMWDVFEERSGDGRLCGGFWMIITITMYLCGVSCITSNARMLYAFARDGAVPGSSIWHVVSPKFGIPLNAVLGMSLAAVMIAIPIVKSTTAYSAVTSITTIGLYISYVTPMFFRILNRADFVPGPWYMGDKLSLFIHGVSCCWVMLICVIFVLPNTYPVSMLLNMNYAIIAVGVVLTYSLGTWFIPGPKPFNARKWFTGPNIHALELDVVKDGGPGASMHGGGAVGVPLVYG